MNLTRQERATRMFALYELRDPRNCEVKYVGISSNVKRRLHSHFIHRRFPVCGGVMGLYCRWMKELSDLGLRPQLCVVSDGYEYGYQQALDAEQELIEAHERSGANLLQSSKSRKQLLRVNHG